MQEQKDQMRDDAVIAFLKSRTLPTPDHIQADINRSVGRRPQLLRYHVYWEEHRLRSGLESLLRSAHQAYVDICRHDAALGSLANATDFERHIDQTVGYAAQKDVMAYCSLAFGALDTLRRIKKRRLDIADKLWQAAARCFNSDVARFLKDLRNNLSHGSVVIPQWQISIQPSGPVGSMMYPKNMLLEFGDWSRSSKQYISSIEDDHLNVAKAILLIHEAQQGCRDATYEPSRFPVAVPYPSPHRATPAYVVVTSSDLDTSRNKASVSGLSWISRKAIGEHFRTLSKFDQSVQDIFYRSKTAAEQDFFNIEDSHKRFLRKQWITISVGQVGKEKDPYDYLHRYFSPEEVREILRRPNHSKEQVDFMIGLKGAEIDCDEELRRKLYNKFAVDEL